MPDYTSILRRSISALPDPSPEVREAVYQRARAALARQLTAVDPPLSTREIETQHQELEDAVSQIEADFAPQDEVNEPDSSEAEEEDLYEPDPQPTYREPSFTRGESAPVAAAPLQDYDPAEEETEEDFEDDEERPSRLPLLAALLVGVLVVGGIGAYGYAERETLFGAFGGGEADSATDEESVQVIAAPGPEPEAPTPEQEAAAADAVADKRPDRLTNGSEPPPVVEPAPDDVAAVDPIEPSPPLEGEAPVEPLPAEAPPLQEETTAALEQPPPDGSIVAQRAIYYFQGAEGSAGQATEGSVAWTQMNRDSGPAIQAILKLGERDVTTTVTIYKNSDTSLPASHLVEVQFSGALGTSAVQRVPALVMKQTEQARGQPLTGAAVPVTDDLFWIALSDDSEQVTRNLQLLREGAWFDIPILFADGTRALLTFEKGVPGDKVFETVMSNWTPS